MAAHDDIRQLVMGATDVVDRVPGRARPSSPRDVETRTLRGTRGGGGVARAEMLDSLNVNSQVMVGHLTLVVGGVADALEIASQRDQQVNNPALTFAVRPALELAGQIAWLLSDSLEAEQRARRYVMWRLADLRSQRLLLRDFQMPGGMSDAADEEVDRTEQEILTDVDAAKWVTRPTKYNGVHLEAASLLGADGKPEQMPKIGQLVHAISPTPGTYGLLSTTSHSHRFGVFTGLTAVGSAAGESTRARLSGLPLDTNLLIGLTVLAVNISTRLLGGWNSVDATRLHSFSRQLMAQAGFS